MGEAVDEPQQEIPTKILKKYVFKQLSVRELYNLRPVCKTWKELIDEMLKKDDKWRKFCKKDFKKVYKHAHKNSPSLSWSNIYKSLCLWTKINDATISSKLFTETSDEDLIGMFQIFDDKIGILFNQVINYYDLKTGQRFEKRDYNDIFTKYMENDKIVALINTYKSRLLICPKTGEFDVSLDFREAFLEVDEDVTNFILVDLNIYYITNNGDISICKITEDLQDADKKYLNQFRGNVISLSYTNRLNILTDKYEIYSLIDNDFRLQYIYTTGPTLFQSLYEYNFLENIAWSEVYRWIATNNLGSDSIGIKWNISAIRAYGDVIFVGTSMGMLSIYLSPFVNGQLDLTMQPVKEIDVGEIARQEEEKIPKECINGDALSEDTRCQVVFIDVVETKNGHKLIVTLVGYVVQLVFKHGNKRKSDDVSPIKIKVSKKY